MGGELTPKELGVDHHAVCDIRIAELKKRIAELERENAMLKDGLRTHSSECWKIIAQDANETEGV